MSDTGNIPRSIAGVPVTEMCEVRRPSGVRIPDQELCGVRVRGTSLEGIGIRENDLALIHLSQEVGQGDLSAVRTPEGLRVGFFHVATEMVACLVLAPGDATDYEPYFYRAEEIQIIGQVIDVRREGRSIEVKLKQRRCTDEE